VQVLEGKRQAPPPSLLERVGQVRPIPEESVPQDVEVRSLHKLSICYAFIKQAAQQLSHQEKRLTSGGRASTADSSGRAATATPTRQQRPRIDYCQQRPRSGCITDLTAAAGQTTTGRSGLSPRIGADRLQVRDWQH
jgi:hypothetical protein